MQQNSDDDDDYEVSNKLVDEYLVQYDHEYNEFLNVNSNFQAQNGRSETNEELEENKKAYISPNKKDEKRLSNNILVHFFDKSSIKRHLESAEFNQVVEITDKNSINESYLRLLNHTQETPNIVKTHPKIILLFILSLLSSLYLSLFYANLIFWLLLVTLVKGVVKIYDIYMLKWLQLAVNYVNSVRRVLTYLREAELVSLSVERRYVLNSKEPMIISDDEVNFEFRRMLFVKLRDEFYRIRRANLELNSSIDPKELISSIDDTDLSEIIRLDVNDAALDEKTDRFSLTCLKTMAKLVRLVLSENFKIIISEYFDLVLNNSSLIKSCLSISIKFGHVFFSLRKSVYDINEFESFLQIRDIQNSTTTVKNVPKQVEIGSDERQLGLYLRNALLNTHSLQNSLNPIESLKLVKVNLEYCDFYVNQLINSLEKPKNEEDSNPIESSLKNETTTKTPTVQNRLDPSEPVTIEDEIYEEDLSRLKDEEGKRENSDDSDWLELNKRGNEVALANKNLFYELKFALKFKSNEWREREKMAAKKRLINEKTTKEDQENMEHLLENDALRNKSELRRRRRKAGNQGAVVEETTNKRKYVYEEEDENSSRREQPDFFKELINKAFMLQQTNEETLVYE